MATRVNPGNVVLEVTVQYGTTSIRVEDLLKIDNGTIIALDQCMNEDVMVRVDGRLVAMGETIGVGSCRGIRITRVVNPDIWLGRRPQ